MQCVCVCVSERERESEGNGGSVWEICVCFEGRPLDSYQCVCVHALFPSVHDFRLCISIRCDLNVRLCCVCASVCVGVFSIVLFLLYVDVVAGGACLCPSLWCCPCCVCVLWLLCISYLSCAVPVFCRVLSVWNSQGHVCQKFYCTYLIDDLESISTLWRRDHLSAIKLLGNLFQATLAHDDFPSNPTSSLALMSKSQTYSPDLHIAPKHSGASLA